MGSLRELSMSVLSVYALPYFSFIFSASASSICSEAMSLVMFAEPSGMTARCLSMFLLNTATVVVSAPMSTSTHPERRSASVSTLSASASGARYISATLMPAVSKHLLRFL